MFFDNEGLKGDSQITVKAIMAEKSKMKISLRHVLTVEALILAAVFVAFFWGETRISVRAAEKKLMEKSASIYEAYVKNMDQVSEMTRMYEEAMQEKADSLAYYIDHVDGVSEKDLKSMISLYDVEDIYLMDEWVEPDNHNMVEYYHAQTADGRTVAIAQSTLLEREITETANLNGSFENLRQSKDFFAIFSAKNEYIIMSSDPDMDSKDGLHKISEFGIDPAELSYEKAKWLEINGTRVLTLAYADPETNWVTLTGIRREDILANSHVFVSLLYAIVTLIMTVLVTYSFFAKQEKKQYTEEDSVKSAIATQKLIVTFVAGLILTSVSAYYIQSLYSISTFSIESTEEKQKIQSALVSTEDSRKNLQAVFDRMNLTEARIVAHYLSHHPELRTMENLQELSDIFGLEYIMMFDEDGVETISNSGIRGFVISDDPESQSYAFNILKYGIPYVIQEARPDDLTGQYHQFIGVATSDTNGQYDGFLQICVSPEQQQIFLEDLSFENLLYSSVSRSETEVLAIEKTDGTICFYSGNTDLNGQYAMDLGVKEEQIKGNYLGVIDLYKDRLYADSFEANGHYIYITSSRDVLFTGRITMSIFSMIVALIAMSLSLLYLGTHDVVDPSSYSTESPYVSVSTPGAENKSTLNILARVMHSQADWADKPSEEKISAIFQFVVLLIGLSIFVFSRLRGVLYSENSVFGFISGNRWNKGFNVFAVTKSLVFILNINLGVYIFNHLLDLFMRLSNPQHETVLRLIKSLAKYVTVILIIYYTLSQFGFDSRSLLASAGLLTLVIGLGAKDLVTDILAGIFIIFENEFQVGDIIEINGYKGRVLEIGIRTTKIINTIQDVKSINNRNLTNLINKTKKNSYCDVIINVPFDQDIDAIRAMLDEELPKVKYKCDYILSGPTNGGIDDMSGRCMKLSIRTECFESHKFEVRTVVNHEIKKMFDRYGFKLA